MTEPIVITPTIQRDIWDCGVSCLEMLLGVPYASIRPLIRYKQPTGLSDKEMKRLAKAFGYPLRFCGMVHDDDIGIICLERYSDPTHPDPEQMEGHYAIYAKDTLYNPAQGQWWLDADDYCRQGKWMVRGILKRKEQ